MLFGTTAGDTTARRGAFTASNLARFGTRTTRVTVGKAATVRLDAGAGGDRGIGIGKLIKRRCGEFGHWNLAQAGMTAQPIPRNQSACSGGLGLKSKDQGLIRGLNL